MHATEFCGEKKTGDESSKFPGNNMLQINAVSHPAPRHSRMQADIVLGTIIANSLIP